MAPARQIRRRRSWTGSIHQKGQDYLDKRLQGELDEWEDDEDKVSKKEQFYRYRMTIRSIQRFCFKKL